MCTRELFYLLATNHVSVQSYTKSMHHKRVTVTTHICQGFFANDVKLPMFFAKVVFSGIRLCFPPPTFHAIQYSESNFADYSL